MGDVVVMIRDEIRRAAPQSDRPSQSDADDRQARERVAREIINTVVPLRDKAEACKLRMVGYLLDMVILEAKDAAGDDARGD